MVFYWFSVKDDDSLLKIDDFLLKMYDLRQLYGGIPMHGTPPQPSRTDLSLNFRLIFVRIFFLSGRIWSAKPPFYRMPQTVIIATVWLRLIQSKASNGSFGIIYPLFLIQSPSFFMQNSWFLIQNPDSLTGFPWIVYIHGGEWSECTNINEYYAMFASHMVIAQFKSWILDLIWWIPY